MGIFYSVSAEPEWTSPLSSIEETVYDTDLSAASVGIKVMAECAYNQAIFEAGIQNAFGILNEANILGTIKDKIASLWKAFKKFVLGIWSKIKAFIDKAKDEVEKEDKETEKQENSTTPPPPSNSATKSEKEPITGDTEFDIVCVLKFAKKYIPDYVNAAKGFSNIVNISIDKARTFINKRPDSTSYAKYLNNRFDDEETITKIFATFLYNKRFDGNTTSELFIKLESSLGDDIRKNTVTLTKDRIDESKPSEFFIMDYQLFNLAKYEKVAKQMLDDVLKDAQAVRKELEQIAMDNIDGDPEQQALAHNVGAVASKLFNDLSKGITNCQKAIIKSAAVVTRLHMLNSTQRRLYNSIKKYK